MDPDTPGLRAPLSRRLPAPSAYKAHPCSRWAGAGLRGSAPASGTPRAGQARLALRRPGGSPAPPAGHGPPSPPHPAAAPGRSLAWRGDTSATDNCDTDTAARGELTGPCSLLTRRTSALFLTAKASERWAGPALRFAGSPWSCRVPPRAGVTMSLARLR